MIVSTICEKRNKLLALIPGARNAARFVARTLTFPRQG